MSTRQNHSGSLLDLAQLRTRLHEQAQEQQRQARAQAQREAQAAREKNLFVSAAGAVQPLPDKRTVLLKTQQPKPEARQFQVDEQAALQESLSDGFDIDTLLDADDQLSYRSAGIGPDVTRNLRRGQWSIQREIDLHGLRRDDAREALVLFILAAHRAGARCVRVVHGKGLGSPGKAPVLKSRVLGWLAQKKEVLAFVQAKPADGGAGAVLVLLAPAS